MNKMNFKFILFFGAMLLLISGLAFGQQDTGQLNGTVKDQNGAVVTGATVKVKDIATNRERTTTTDSDGYYSFTNLLTGEYEITVSNQGFATKSVRANVNIGGASTNNIELSVGAATGAVVDVVDSNGIAEVNTTDQQQSTVVNSRQIENLPILNNNPYSLVQLAPNVSTNDPSGRGAGVAINGQRAASTNILLDGTENVDTFTAGIGQTPPQDSVDEFRIITNTFNPEFGRASGGVVNVATKRGGNNFTGTVFFQNRNSRIASNGYDNNASGVRKPVFNRNQDGVTVGGPIVKDKFFFFDSFQSTIVRSSGEILTWIPTAATIAGANANTQSFFAAHGTVRSDVTPTGLTETLGAGFTVRQVRFSSPIDGGGGAPTNNYKNVLRLDYALSDNTTVYGSWKYDRDTDRPGVVDDSPYTGYTASSKDVANNFQVGIQHNFSSNFLFDTKVAYRRTVSSTALGKPAATPTMHLFSAFGARASDGNFITLPGYVANFPGSGLPTSGTEQLWDIKPNATYSWGNHQFRFGGQFVRLESKVKFGAYEGANFFLSAGANLGTAITNFLAGNAALLNVAVDPQGKFPGDFINTPVTSPNFNRTNQYNEFALHFGDNWRVASGLTLNLGLRYEYFGPQKSKEGLDSNFYFGSGSTLQERIRNGSVAAASSKGGLWKADKNNWSPFLGFAWDVTGDGKTSVRGGYSIGFERNFGNVTYNVQQNPPFNAVLSVPSIITASNFGSLGTNIGPQRLPRSSLRHVREDIVTAYAHRWSASVEREIARSTTAKFEYAGSAGRDLYSLENINRAGTGPRYLGSNPTNCNGLAGNNRLHCQYGNINTRANNSYNDYNSFSASLESNNLFSTGMITTLRYTRSVNKDNLSSTFSESGNNFNLGLLDPFNPALDYGFSDFDTRHRFVGQFIYPIPFKLDNSVANHILGGWNVSSIFSIESGAPFTIFDCANGITVCIRMEGGGSLKFNGLTVDSGAANNFNFVDLSGVPSSTFTDVSGGVEVGPYPTNMTRRNSFRRPGQWYADASLFKDIKFGERYKLSLRMDAFNVFNHANAFIDGNADVTFGYSDPTGTTRWVRAFKAGRRTAQVSARFSF